MKPKYIAGITLIAIGCVLSFKGATEGNQGLVNAGIGGIFLGVVLLTFSTTDYVKIDALKAFATPYVDFTKKLVESLGLMSKAVYIPPYENLPEGGVFIPLHDDFDMDLAKLDEGVMFLTDVGREKEMGLLISPLGKELVKMYESYAELDFTGMDVQAVENASAVLKSLGLAKSVVVERADNMIKIYVEGVRVKTCSNACERIACPICSSILLAIAKCLQELIVVESFRFVDGTIEITVKRLGGVREWM